jgi:hypothetical protein
MACAAMPAMQANQSGELLFNNVETGLGAPTLLVHNIDGRVSGSF